MRVLYEKEHSIFSLAHEGKLEEIRKLIAQDPSLMSLRTSEGNALILCAADGGDLTTVKYLLENGANLYETTHYGASLLLLAAKNGHLALVKWLVNEKKTSLAKPDNDGDTALLLAAYNGHFDLVKWLVDEKKVSLSEKNHRGDTIMLLAAYNGHIDLVKWLVDEQNVSLSEKDRFGNTASLLAAYKGHFDLVKWLVDEKKVSLSEKNHRGDTVMLLAAYKGHFDLVKWLVNVKNVNPSEENHDGNTPALYAVRNSHFDLAQWLIEKKININAIDSDNKTLLYYMAAAKNPPLKVIASLLKYPSLSYLNVLFLHDISTLNLNLKQMIDKDFPWVNTIMQPPDTLVCPITREVMRFPVKAPDGHSYEKQAIVSWLQHHHTSPLTRHIMDIHALTKDIETECRIKDFLNEAAVDLDKKRMSAFASDLLFQAGFFAQAPSSLSSDTSSPAEREESTASKTTKALT